MKVHQNIILNGKDLGDADYRKHSKFYNEGKWDNFIKPLLPKGEVFVEFGSNAGLYLKLATENGFSKVTGYERDSRDCKVATLYRDSLGLDYDIVKTQIDKNLEYLADVTLLANFHYHQHVTEFIEILDQMEVQSCYALIVSVNHKLTHWRANPNEEIVEWYFKNWQLVEHKPMISPEGDPHPRKMFSYLFRSRKIRRVDFDEVKLRGELKENDEIVDFIKRVLTEKDLDITDTRYYKIQNYDRKGRWSSDKILKFIEGKRDLILDIAKNGIQKPIVLDQITLNLVDGLHRYLVAKVLGHKSIIVR